MFRWHTDKRIDLGAFMKVARRCFRSLHSSAGLVKPRRRHAPLKFEKRPAGRGANLCHWDAMVRSAYGVIVTVIPDD
jgi:hypothetical protein